MSIRGTPTPLRRPLTFSNEEDNFLSIIPIRRMSYLFYSQCLLIISTHIFRRLLSLNYINKKYVKSALTSTHILKWRKLISLNYIHKRDVDSTHTSTLLRTSTNILKSWKPKLISDNSYVTTIWFKTYFAHN